MFVKLVKEEQVIDCIEDPLFVKWQKKNSVFIACDEPDGEGIVSSDGGKIYHLAGVRSHGRFTFGDVTYEEISEDEYKETIEQMAEEAKANQTYTLDEAAAIITQEVAA